MSEPKSAHGYAIYDEAGNIVYYGFGSTPEYAAQKHTSHTGKYVPTDYTVRRVTITPDAETT